jgi:TetR/AcrR family transcriptional regulator, transcriptional repressor of bet genes
MLQFALQRVGEDLQARLVERVGALPEPRDPSEIVAIVMRERLPLTAARHMHAQVLVAWLGRAAVRPELTSYVIEGTRQMREYLAGQLRRAQQAGQVAAAADAGVAADGLLALNEGLAAQLLQGVHTPAGVDAVLADHLDRIFAGPASQAADR